MGNTECRSISSCCSNDPNAQKKEVDIDQSQSISNSQVIPNKKRRLMEGVPSSAEKSDQNQALTPEQEIQRIEYLKKIVHKAPVLVLKVINSTTLKKGETFKINAQGIEGSLRGKKDGFTYFGCKKKLTAPGTSGFDNAEIINDFVIRNKDPETNDRHRGRHFQIEYNIEHNVYRIRDLGIGFGSFIRIDGPLVLKDNNLLSMGSTFLIINIDDEKESFVHTNSQDNLKENMPKLPAYAQVNDPPRTKYTEKKEIPNKHSQITIKMFGGPNFGEVYHFDSGVPHVRLGRMPECEIKIEDNLLSKYQATIKYEQNCWVMHDGFNNKYSTNGNWLYLNDDYDLTSGKAFKANHTLFEVQIENKGDKYGKSRIEP